MKRCKYCNKPISNDRDFCLDDHEKRYQMQKVDTDHNVMMIIFVSLALVIYAFIAIILKSMQMITISISILGAVMLIFLRVDRERFDDHMIIWKRWYRPSSSNSEYPKAIAYIISISMIIIGMILTLMI